jgi:uncharacterized protein (TIGR02246 family)
MKTRARTFALAVPLLVVTACGQAQDTAADAEAVRAVPEAERAAYESGNTAALADLVTDDVVVMPPNQAALHGRQALVEWETALAAQMTVTFQSYQSDDIQVSGDVAIERYSGSVTFTPKAGGEAMSETMKGIHIYRRQADGSWKISQDIWSSNEPMPGM